MATITYKPAEVLHWFEVDAKKSAQEARERGSTIADRTSKEGLVVGLKDAASAAYSFGKGAFGGIVQRSAEETKYELHEDGLSAVGIAFTNKIDYKQIRQIIAQSSDKFQVLYNGGHITIKPVAHLVAGRYKVPVGWLRNGIEVPYAMLIEEISARSGIEIEPA